MNLKIKSATKLAAKSLSLNTGLLRAAARFKQPGAVILMYHSIVKDPRETADGIGVSQPSRAFELHMRVLVKRFQPVTIEQVARFATGESSLPAHAVAVTFDDGFRDNYDVALPILTRYGIPATFYILVGAVDSGVPPWYCRIRWAFSRTLKKEWTDPERGKSFSLSNPASKQDALNLAWDMGAAKSGSGQEAFVRSIEADLEKSLPFAEAAMMSWDQVRALRRAGHIAGAHTMTHPNLAHVTAQEVEREVSESKAKLEAELQEPIEHFSYPHPALDPQWSAATAETVQSAGFRSATLTTGGCVQSGDSPLALKRIYAANDLRQWEWNLEMTFLGRPA